MTTPTIRPLSVIAADIRAHWAKPYFGAMPYIDAMATLYSVDDAYGQDDARSIVLYFLSNASTFRGPEARKIKAELRAMVGLK